MTWCNNFLVAREVLYLCKFGIAPYFADQLLEKVRSSSNYVLLFDETLNKDLQEKQMDIYVCIWDGNRVASCYQSSEFLGHARAVDMLEIFNPVISNLGHRGLLQLSMDGPAVNWKLYELLRHDIAHSTPLKMLEIGSCGLHVLNNAF